MNNSEKSCKYPDRTVGKPVLSDNWQSVDEVTAEMVCALKNGDTNAFNRVYSLYHNPLKTFVYALLKSDFHSQEICQEVFVKIWLTRERLEPEKNIRSYIYTITRNMVFNHIRDTKNKKLTPFEDGDDIPAASSHSTEEEFIAYETELLVRMVVSRMPRQRKLIYEMRYFQGLSLDEISQRLDINRNTVERHLSFARKEIRDVITIFLIFISVKTSL